MLPELAILFLLTQHEHQRLSAHIPAHRKRPMNCRSTVRMDTDGAFP